MSLDEVKNYEEVYGRPTPIRYDILKLSDEHRKFDGLIRRYWNDLHPLVRDMFTSFANEFQYLLDLAGEVEKVKDEEINNLRNQMVEKLNEMNSNLEIIQNEHSSHLQVKDEKNGQLENEINKLNEIVKEITEKLTRQSESIEDKNKLISSQKEEINRLRKELNEKSTIFQENTEILSTSIESVENFTKQLDLLEKGMKIVENERDDALIEIVKLKEKIEKQETEFAEVLGEKNEKLQSIRVNMEKIYKDYEKSKAEAKAMKKRNLANEEKVIQLEARIEKLNTEFMENKKYLENQVRINKSYHTLTLKVLGKSEEKREVETKSTKISDISPKKTKSLNNVPDLLSQISRDMTKEEIKIVPPDKPKVLKKKSVQPEISINKSAKPINDDATVTTPEKTEILEKKSIQPEISIKKAPKPIIDDVTGANLGKNSIEQKMQSMFNERRDNPIKYELKALLKSNVSDLQTTSEINSKELLNKMRESIIREDNEFKKVLSDFPSTPKKIKKKTANSDKEPMKA